MLIIKNLEMLKALLNGFLLLSFELYSPFLYLAAAYPRTFFLAWPEKVVADPTPTTWISF